MWNERELRERIFMAMLQHRGATNVTAKKLVEAVDVVYKYVLTGKLPE